MLLMYSLTAFLGSSLHQLLFSVVKEKVKIHRTKIHQTVNCSILQQFCREEEGQGEDTSSTHTPPPSNIDFSLLSLSLSVSPLEVCFPTPTPTLCHLENSHYQVDVIFPRKMINLVIKVLKTQ